MKFALIHKLTLFFLVLTGVLPLLLSGELSLYLTPTFGVLFVCGWFLPESLMKKNLYRAAATALVVGVFVIECIRIFNGVQLATATIEFSVVILGVKLCMRSEFGDFQQIVLMSFIAIIASTVTSYNVSYALFFIIFVFLSPVAMFLTQMRKEMEIRFTRADDAMRQRLFNSSRIVTGKNIGVPLAGAVILLVLTSLIFALIPRLGVGAGGGLFKGTKLFGFSESVKIGDLSQTMEQDDVFLRLWPSPPQKQPPAKLQIKFRGQVFDTWENGAWHASTGEGFRFYSSANGIFILNNTPPRYESGFRIMQASTNPPYLFLPTESHSLLFAPSRRLGQKYYPQLQTNTNGVFKYQDRRKVGIRYDVVLGGKPFENFGDSNLAPYMQLPENADRIGALARRWTAGANDPKDKIKKILQRFQREFGYTKTVSEAERRAAAKDNLQSDIVNRFLFNYRKGTCEHFATASVLMFRSLGIPSRFITGFQGAKWNSVGEYYSVDASNAHAWVEVRVNDRWRTVDPTPVRVGSGDGAGAGYSLYFSQLMDTLAMHWHQYIIDYNENTQSNLMATILPRGNQPEATKRFSLSQRHLALAALLVLVFFALTKRRQLAKLRHIFRPGKSVSVAPSTALYLRLERLLSQRMGPRPPSQTPWQYLALAAEKWPAEATLLNDFNTQYHSARFGGKPMSPATGKNFREQISRLALQSKPST